MADARLTDDGTKRAGSPAGRRRARWILPILAAIAAGAWVAQRSWVAWRDDPRRLWERAQAAWSSRRLEEAEAILVRLARQRPPPLAERLLRAEVARQRGRIDQALAALDGLPDTDPGAALIERTRGMLEFQRDRARPAEGALLRALELDPNCAEARRDLVDLYVVESRADALEAQFRHLASLGPLGFDDLYMWTLGRRSNIGPADLAAKLERMLVNDPDDRLVRLALAEDLRRLGRLEQAGTVLAPLPNSDPEAQAARARLELDGGRVQAAARLLAEGPPGHPALAPLRGRMALARGDATAAIGHYRTALAAEPDDRDSLTGLGQALRLAGQPDAAQPYLQAARDRNRLEWLVENARSLSRRQDSRALRSIGDACRALGRLPEARAWYRLALDRDPLDAELQKRLFQLGTALGHDSPQPGPRPPQP